MAGNANRGYNKVQHVIDMTKRSCCCLTDTLPIHFADNIVMRPLGGSECAGFSHCLVKITQINAAIAVDICKLQHGLREKNNSTTVSRITVAPLHPY